MATGSCGIEGNVHKIRACFVLLELLSKDSQCKSLSFSNCFLSGLPIHQGSPKFRDFRYPATIHLLLKLNCEVHAALQPD